MHHETPELSAVLARLDKLERLNRRLKLAGFLGLILVGTLVLMAQAGPYRTVEANEFILRDADGKMRAHLNMGSDGPEFVLIDANGKGRAGLAVRGDVSGLYLYDAYERARVGLAEGPDVQELAFYDAKGRKQSNMLAGTEMAGVSVGVGADDYPKILIVTTLKNGKSVLTLNDTNRRPRVLLSVSDNEKEGLFLYDVGGNPVFAKP